MNFVSFLTFPFFAFYRTRSKTINDLILYLKKNGNLQKHILRLNTNKMMELTYNDHGEEERRKEQSGHLEKLMNTIEKRHPRREPVKGTSNRCYI